MKRLDEIEARARNGALMHDIGPTSDREWALCATAIREDVPALVAALRAVLAVHAPDYTYPDCPKCAECSDIASTEAQRFVVLWPCPTVAAIRQHLGEDA